MAEEHFQIGQNLRARGTLSIGDTPGMFRPPGFPAFVAGVLVVRDAVFASLPDKRAVAFGNGLLLSLGALLVYGYTLRSGSPVEALGAGLLYAFHPLNLVIAQSLSYQTLHIFSITAATLALSGALTAERRKGLRAMGAGLLWGVSTLILPPFVLVLALFEQGIAPGDGPFASLASSRWVWLSP